MNINISILVADGHPMLLKGITDELLNLDYVVYNAANGAQALEVIISKNPTIVFLDISMPYLTGFEVIKKCQLALLKTKFIIFTAHKEKGFLLKAKQMNLDGYLLKEEPFSEIKKCMQAVLKGEFYVSKIFDEIFTNEISSEMKKIKLLSASEITIIHLIASKNSTKEIAIALAVSKRTIDKHRSNIVKKLGLTSGRDAISFWVSENKDFLENV